MQWVLMSSFLGPEVYRSRRIHGGHLHTVELKDPAVAQSKQIEATEQDGWIAPVHSWRPGSLMENCWCESALEEWRNWRSWGQCPNVPAGEDTAAWGFRQTSIPFLFHAGYKAYWLLSSTTGLGHPSLVFWATCELSTDAHRSVSPIW